VFLQLHSLQWKVAIGTQSTFSVAKGVTFLGGILGEGGVGDECWMNDECFNVVTVVMFEIFDH